MEICLFYKGKTLGREPEDEVMNLQGQISRPY